MTLRELIDRGFVPGGVCRNMRRTTPGALAHFVDKLLYDLLEDGDVLKCRRQTFVHTGTDDGAVRYAGLVEAGVSRQSSPGLVSNSLRQLETRILQELRQLPAEAAK